MPGVFGLREARVEQIKNISTSSFRYWSESAKYGYFGGGYMQFPATRICTIIRLDFSNETVSDPGNKFVTARQNAAGVSNNSYGYFAGGQIVSTVTDAITRLDFSNETVNNAANNLPSQREAAAGVTNSN